MDLHPLDFQAARLSLNCIKLCTLISSFRKLHTLSFLVLMPVARKLPILILTWLCLAATTSKNQITVNGETIVSTYDHPYYVKGKYFVNACDLWIGAELVNNNEIVRLVEQLYREALGESSVEVFNFKPVDRTCDDYKFEIGFSVFICKKTGDGFTLFVPDYLNNPFLNTTEDLLQPHDPL